MEHPEIYEKPSTEVKCYGNKELNLDLVNKTDLDVEKKADSNSAKAVNMGSIKTKNLDPVKSARIFSQNGNSIDEKQTLLVNRLEIPKSKPSKRGRNLISPNYEEKSMVTIESEPNDSIGYLAIDETEKEPIDDFKKDNVSIREIDMNKTDIGFEQGENDISKVWEMETVTKRDSDLVEFVNEKTQYGGHKFDGNDISTIKLNQGANVETSGIKEGASPDENIIEAICNKFCKKMMFGIHFRIIATVGSDVTAECNNCKVIVNDSIVTCSNTRHHLEVHFDFVNFCNILNEMVSGKKQYTGSITY